MQKQDHGDTRGIIATIVAKHFGQGVRGNLDGVCASDREAVVVLHFG